MVLKMPLEYDICTNQIQIIPKEQCSDRIINGIEFAVEMSS